MKYRLLRFVRIAHCWIMPHKYIKVIDKTDLKSLVLTSSGFHWEGEILESHHECLYCRKRRLDDKLVQSEGKE